MRSVAVIKSFSLGMISSAPSAPSVVVLVVERGEIFRRYMNLWWLICAATLEIFDFWQKPGLACYSLNCLRP